MKSRIFIRLPTLADADEFISAAKASRKLHGQWIDAPDDNEKFSAYLARMSTGNNFPLLICRTDNRTIVGVVNISNAVMGAFRSAYLGYYVFAGHERQGLMREGLRAAVRHAFGPLGLHRLEANIQPENTASIALVRSIGFKLEGYSPRYLKIFGRWRDHERWAIVAD
jgi:[ribosomal protein S5]-alanine N-acetyltransferase